MKRPGQLRSSPLPPRRERMTRSAIKSAPDGKPIDHRRKPRTRSEFARIYGSKKRVAWIKSQPCIAAVWGCVGPMQNAHTENGGMGRKADAKTIVPACQHHHDEMHHEGVRTFAMRYGVHPKALAVSTEAAWQRSQSDLTHIGSVVPSVVARLVEREGGAA